MKKNLIYLMIAAALAASCNNFRRSDIPELEGFLILNNGSMGQNDACVANYDPSIASVNPDVFSQVNGLNLGDTAQDIIKVGPNIFIAVSNSQVIFLTDSKLKIVKKIEPKVDGVRLTPRYFARDNDALYVSFTEGYVGRLDLNNLSLKYCKVGRCPEGLAICGRTLCVANSGGMDYPNYDKTLSIVDLATFSEREKIEVNLNPQKVVASADENAVYVNSFGDYGSVLPSLQKVELGTRQVKDLEYEGVKDICAGEEGIMYVVTGTYGAGYKVLGNVYSYDMKTDNGNPSPVNAQPIDDYYSISYTGGRLFVGKSDYMTVGSVADILEKEPAYVLSMGLNPIKVIEL